MILGVDIGGTKIAVCLAKEQGEILLKESFPSAGPKESLERIVRAGKKLLEQGTHLLAEDPLRGIGVSCGSPQDSKRGLILAPPNLPEWTCVPVTDLLSDAFGVPSFLCNDANACALAEWRYGAGKGCSNMIFLTFGTGLGAGLILDGRLYEGSCGMAGEAGHIRLAEEGPVGYGKAGSFEGFASGGGIRRLGIALAKEALAKGEKPLYMPTLQAEAEVSARTVAEAAEQGDSTALAVYEKSGEMLGRGLAVLIDLFNPERIVIGSIFVRAGKLLIPAMEKAIAREALPENAALCRILPAALGENLGDFGALAAAVRGLKEEL